MAHKNYVVENHRDCKKLKETVKKLHRDFKQHFIFEHLPEYLELTGKTLSKKNVETSHAKLEKFISSHNYQIRI